MASYTIYEGMKTTQGRCIVHADGQPLDPCAWFRNHSPDGFEWGYAGSGPAQLALAILMHHFRRVEGVGKRCAVALVTTHYQHFKRHVIACLPAGWRMDTRAVAEFVKMQAREEADAGDLVDWNLWRSSAFERGVLLATSGTPVIRA